MDRQLLGESVNQSIDWKQQQQNIIPIDDDRWIDIISEDDYYIHNNRLRLVKIDEHN